MVLPNETFHGRSWLEQIDAGQASKETGVKLAWEEIKPPH